MKKYLLLLLLCLRIPFLAQCQTTPNPIDPSKVVSVKAGDLQKLLIAAQQKDVLQEKIVLLERDYKTLTAEVAAYDRLDSTNIQILRLKDEQLTYLKTSIENYKQEIVILNKEIKRWKRKTRATAIAGTLATGLVTYLYFTK